jgi:hypothetical protein
MVAKVFRALYDFKPEVAEEIALRKGDCIDVENVDPESGWGEGASLVFGEWCSHAKI